MNLQPVNDWPDLLGTWLKMPAQCEGLRELLTGEICEVYSPALLNDSELLIVYTSGKMVRIGVNDEGCLTFDL